MTTPKKTIKLYKYEYDSFLKTKIIVKEIEATETPKMFIIQDMWERRIKKENIGKLIYRFGYIMYSYSLCFETFKNAILATKRKSLDDKISQVKALAEELQAIKSLTESGEMIDPIQTKSDTEGADITAFKKEVINHIAREFNVPISLFNDTPVNATNEILGGAEK